MVFSSPLFLFTFLPICLAIYFAIQPKLRNAFLLVASSLFYMWGAGSIVGVLLFSVALNYYLSLLIERQWFPRFWLTTGVVINLGMLFYYKYTSFAVDQLNHAWSFFGGQSWHVPQIVLPLGISFFTFQGISYLIDVYRREVSVAPSLIGYGMYHTLFPQLIAGPIVRYSEVSRHVSNAHVDSQKFFDGIVRFVSGLGKKILLADSLGVVADTVFGLPDGELTCPLAWLGIICYSQQILCDFSGYSDMAIGLGKMLGFDFPENFDQPYRAQSITEFWRRWHMTLSRCLRDYLYIPLGGNRKGTARTYLNLCIVFVLCGLWHGAAWTFVVWGAFHGGLLIAERVAKNRFQLAPSGVFGILLTNLLVMISWVVFRADSLPAAGAYLRAMFSLRLDASRFFDVSYYMTADRVLALSVALAISFVPFEQLAGYRAPRPVGAALRGAWALSLLGYSVAVIAVQGFNPFIYFRF